MNLSCGARDHQERDGVAVGIPAGKAPVTLVGTGVQRHQGEGPSLLGQIGREQRLASCRLTAGAGGSSGLSPALLSGGVSVPGSSGAGSPEGLEGLLGVWLLLGGDCGSSVSFGAVGRSEGDGASPWASPPFCSACCSVSFEGSCGLSGLSGAAGSLSSLPAAGSCSGR